ncbi:hypothetical protein L1887_54884 [Cichorium endivia]|nr:hypothetical protein L1887_54884 [Cichorium endivia]
MLSKDPQDESADRKSDILVVHNMDDASVQDQEKALPGRGADQETAKYAAEAYKDQRGGEQASLLEHQSQGAVHHASHVLLSVARQRHAQLRIHHEHQGGCQPQRPRVPVARNDPLHGYPRRRIAPEPLASEAARGQAARRQCILLGAVVACSAASHNFASLMVVRFLLGFFESTVQPCFILITSMWYRRSEQAVLTSLWYCMSGVQLMVGGLLAYGVAHYTNGVIYPWQLLFMVLGLATVALSVVIAFVLPDSPMSAKCFTEDDKRLMVERVRENETGIQNRQFKRHQVLEALTDPFAWCLFGLIVTANLVIGGLGVFSNLIISQFGFSYLQTQLLNIAQGAVTIIVMVGSAYVSQKWGQTCFTMLLWTIPAVVGTVVILVVKPTKNNAGGLLIAFYCTQFFLAQGNMIISLVSRNIAGQTKKSTVITMTFVGWGRWQHGCPANFPDQRRSKVSQGLHRPSVHLWRLHNARGCHSTYPVAQERDQTICR